MRYFFRWVIVLTSLGTRKRILEGENGGRRDNLILMAEMLSWVYF